MELNLVGTKVTINNRTLMFEQDNLTATINLTVDTTGYAYKLDMQMPKQQCTDVQLYNVLDFAKTQSDGNFQIQVTDSMFPVAGKYLCQIRGIKTTDSGVEVYHSQTFEIWVKFSALPYHIWNPVPSEFFQIEYRIGEINSHPPYPNSTTGYWMIWNPETQEYEQSEYPVGVTLPPMDDTTTNKYLTNDGENPQWRYVSVNGKTTDDTGNISLDASDIEYTQTGDSVSDYLSALENNKINKVPSATSGNLAEFDADGGIVDSGTNVNEINNEISTKQDVLVSGENIKTVNRQSILGSGNLDAGLVDDVKINNVSIVEQKIAQIIYETGLGNDSNNAATTTAIREYVNSSINAVAAYYITSDAQGDAFATKAALDYATENNQCYYAGQIRTPTRNDYTIVIADETHSGKTARYTYTENQWAFQYTFNMEFTQAQIDAINSGINAIKVQSYDNHLVNTNNPHNVTFEQVKPEGGIPKTDINPSVYASIPVIQATRDKGSRFTANTSGLALETGTILAIVFDNPVGTSSANVVLTDNILNTSTTAYLRLIDISGQGRAMNPPEDWFLANRPYLFQYDYRGGSYRFLICVTPRVTANVVQGTMDISQGGTGATTAEQARENLGAQPTLPSVVNDRYLHTNADTGALEWTEVQGGSGGFLDDILWQSPKNFGAVSGGVAGDNIKAYLDVSGEILVLKGTGAMYSAPAFYDPYLAEVGLGQTTYLVGKIFIQSGITTIGNFVFNRLYSGYQAGAFRYWNNVFGTTETQDRIGYVGGTLVLPDTITSIGNNAFLYYRAKANKFIINSTGRLAIGDNAFQGSDIWSMAIPNCTAIYGYNANAFDITTLRVFSIGGTIEDSIAFTSTLLDDASLINIANHLMLLDGETTRTITLASAVKTRLASLMGTVADNQFTQSSSGTVSLQDFITNTRGWTIA